MKLNCEIIKDLLPLYCDSICSAESTAAVEEHLSECVPCTEELQKLKSELPEPSLQTENESSIIGIYKKRLIRKVLFFCACCFFFPLLNSIDITCDGLSVYIFFVTAIIMVCSVYIPTTAKKNRTVKIVTAFGCSAGALIFLTCSFSMTHVYCLFALGVFICVSLAVSLPQTIKEPLDPFEYKKAALRIMLAESVIFYASSILDILTAIGEGVIPLDTMFIVSLLYGTFKLLFLWGGFFVFKLKNFDILFKIGVCIAMLGVCLSTYEIIRSRLMGNWIPDSRAYWVAGYSDWANTNSYAIALFIFLFFLLPAAVFITMGILRKEKKSKNSKS